MRRWGAGARAYFEALDASRHEYAAWMEDVLKYAHARGKRALEVGCGQGIDLVRYARHGGVVTGLDLTPQDVILARQHLSATGLHGTVVEGMGRCENCDGFAAPALA